ncbi:MAG: hypothetical protein U0P45_16605 [Acidimicrobiales bacterium]
MASGGADGASSAGSGAPTVLHIREPRVEGQRLVVSWAVEPDPGLWRASSFELCFPPAIDLAGLPPRLAWTVALLCLHPTWALLGDGRVELPVALGPGEAEVWLRLVDAIVDTHDRTAAAHAAAEGRSWPARPGRRVALVEGDQPIAAAPVGPEPGVGPTAEVVAAFSGGKDGLLQVALLAELGIPTVAVAVTSPLPDRDDQRTARRAEVLRELPERLPVELVEVRSDLRALVDNDAPARLGWHISVCEMTDTHLYVAACLVAAWARGAGQVVLASEAEVQENVEVDGVVVQHPHLMYSAATQQVVSALTASSGIAVGSLTYPLPSGLVQRMLWHRYPQVRDLQYSCWRVRDGEAECSECSQCLRIAVAALAAGGSPAEMGIDVDRLFRAQQGWRPGGKPELGLPDDAVRRSLHDQVVRNLAAVDPAEAARTLGLHRFASTVRSYGRLRRSVLAVASPTPEPGWRAGYLRLVPPTVAERVGAICDEAFPRAAEATYLPALERTERLVGAALEPLATTPRGALP